MSGKMIVWPADGDRLPREFTLDEPPGLAMVQAGVGGYVELVTAQVRWQGQPAEFYCNEEGKLEALSINYAATAFLRQQIPQFTDEIVGCVVLLVGDARWSLVIKEGDE